MQFLIWKELEKEQDSRMQDFLLLDFEKRCLHPNNSVSEHLFSLKFSLTIVMATVLKNPHFY